jgi:hypothetical protein
VIAFSIGELKCPDLNYVYDMTWAEFQIRLFSYKRQDVYRWQMLRELMWTSYIAPHLDPKKMAKRKENLLSLESDKKNPKGVTQEHKDSFIKAFKQWQQETS